MSPTQKSSPSQEKEVLRPSRSDVIFQGPLLFNLLSTRRHGEFTHSLRHELLTSNAPKFDRKFLNSTKIDFVDGKVPFSPPLRSYMCFGPH